MICPQLNPGTQYLLVYLAVSPLQLYVPVVCDPPYFIIRLQIPEINAPQAVRPAEGRGAMSAETCSFKKVTALNSQETKFVLVA